MQEQQLNVMRDTKALKCSCGHEYFKPLVMIREVSALLTGTGKDEILQIPVMVCAKCDKAFERPSVVV